MSKEEFTRQAIGGTSFGFSITLLNPLWFLVFLFSNIYYDLKHPSFDSDKDKTITLKPWERGY